MKQRILSITLIAICLVGAWACTNSGNHSDSDRSAEKWKLSILAYTFRNNSFFEAVDKASELGLNYICGYPGQPIGNGVQGTMEYTMDEGQREKVLNYLASKNIKLIDFGVISPNTEKEWTALFDFAKAMGIENIVSEPDPKHLDLVSQLCDTYQIKVAIHNHAAPSHYWNPDSLMKEIEGKSELIGVCADVGHWARSGLDPVKSLQKVQDRLMELHFKDVSSDNKDAIDVVWGTGVNDVKAMLEELIHQKFSGILAIEYESNPQNNMQEIKECLDFYKKVVE